MKHYKISSYSNEIEDYNDVVRITDFDNFFRVYEDKKRSRKMFNLNSSMYFSVDRSSLPMLQL